MLAEAIISVVDTTMAIEYRDTIRFFNTWTSKSQLEVKILKEKSFFLKMFKLVTLHS